MNAMERAKIEQAGKQTIFARSTGMYLVK